MKHISSKVRIVLVLAVVLTAVLVILSGLTGKNYAATGVQAVLAPLRSGVNTLRTQAEKYYNYMFRYEALEAENAALREQIARMKEDARSADSLARENERLRSVLDLKGNREDFTFVDAYVISRSSGDWVSSFTINRGSSSGIEAGMCVISDNSAVVGLVSEVGPNYAVVKTVLDSSLEISATIASSGNSGIVQGAYASGAQGYLRMDYLPSSAVIRNQDQVVTSGSTVYPRGLLLGYVVDAGFDDSGVAKYAVLEPAADIADVEQVFIVTSFSAG